jgi:hypothetical protein
MWEPAPISYARRADDILGNLAPFLQNSLPAIERPFLMITEGDVLRATTLYVVHPINLALNAKYRNTPIYCAENFREGICCDITWKYHNGEDLVTIAVLELKRRGVLWWDEFECAKSDARNRDDKMEEAYENMDDDDRVATTFEGNAVKLSQQAAAYAIRQRTQFIGLFDWDSMFLFQFCKLDLAKKDIGDWAYGTWVEDTEPTFFRKTLFGFLVAACEAKIGT